MSQRSRSGSQDVQAPGVGGRISFSWRADDLAVSQDAAWEDSDEGYTKWVGTIVEIRGQGELLVQYDPNCEMLDPAARTQSFPPDDAGDNTFVRVKNVVFSNVARKPAPFPQKAAVTSAQTTQATPPIQQLIGRLFSGETRTDTPQPHYSTYFCPVIAAAKGYSPRNKAEEWKATRADVGCELFDAAANIIKEHAQQQCRSVSFTPADYIPEAAQQAIVDAPAVMSNPIWQLFLTTVQRLKTQQTNRETRNKRENDDQQQPAKFFEAGLRTSVRT